MLLKAKGNPLRKENHSLRKSITMMTKSLKNTIDGVHFWYIYITYTFEQFHKRDLIVKITSNLHTII